MRYKYLIILTILAFAAFLYSPTPGFATVILGSAQDFAVLGYAGVTNTGTTTIYGNVGVDPDALTYITGLTPAMVTGGTINGPGGVSLDARNDFTTAHNYLGGLPFTSNLTGHVLGSAGYATLTPGVYKFDSTADLTGVLTLDAGNNPDALFVFQIGSGLTTASASSVNVINGNSGTGVYWLTGAEATLGSSTVFAGNILAYAGISLNSTAKILCGRAFSQTASVTLIGNTISNNNFAQDFHELNNNIVRDDFGSYGFSGGSAAPVPEPSTMLLLGLGSVATAFIRGRRKA